jgi:hypothetical protein
MKPKRCTYLAIVRDGIIYEICDLADYDLLAKYAEIDILDAIKDEVEKLDAVRHLGAYRHAA